MSTKGLGKGVPSNIPNPTAVGTEGVSRERAAESGQRCSPYLASPIASAGDTARCWVDPAVWFLYSYFDKISGGRKSKQKVSAIGIVCFDKENFHFVFCFFFFNCATIEEFKFMLFSLFYSASTLQYMIKY